MSFIRRQELTCGVRDLDTYKDIVLKENENIWVIQDDGNRLLKVGDGVTGLKDLPYNIYAAGTATTTFFNNSGTGLESTNVQDVISEVYDGKQNILISKTSGFLIDIKETIVSYFANLVIYGNTKVVLPNVNEPASPSNVAAITHIVDNVNVYNGKLTGQTVPTATIPLQTKYESTYDLKGFYDSNNNLIKADSIDFNGMYTKRIGSFTSLMDILTVIPDNKGNDKALVYTQSQTDARVPRDMLVTKYISNKCGIIFNEDNQGLYIVLPRSYTGITDLDTELTRKNKFLSAFNDGQCIVYFAIHPDSYTRLEVSADTRTKILEISRAQDTNTMVYSTDNLKSYFLVEYFRDTTVALLMSKIIEMAEAHNVPTSRMMPMAFSFENEEETTVETKNVGSIMYQYNNFGGF